MTAEEAGVLADALGSGTADHIKKSTPGRGRRVGGQVRRRGQGCGGRQPDGHGNWLEETDCAEIQPWFDRFVKK